MECPTCGAQAYSTEFTRLYELAYQCHPLIRLDPVCNDCNLHAMGLQMPPKYLNRRAAWLQSGGVLPVLDLKDPDVAAAMARNREATKLHQRQQAQLKQLKRQVRWEREMRKWDKIERKRASEFRKVVKRAAEE